MATASVVQIEWQYVVDLFIFQQILTTKTVIQKYLCVHQGYLYTSTVDYLTQDPAHISYIWILMVSGWMLPNIVMVTFHAMVIIAFRCSVCTGYLYITILIYLFIYW